MSKKKATTKADLEGMGLFETSPGVFSKTPLEPKHETRGFEVLPKGTMTQGHFDKNVSNIPKQTLKYLPDVDLAYEIMKHPNFTAGVDPYKTPLTPDQVVIRINPEHEFHHSAEELMDIYRKTGTMLYKPTPTRRTEPFPIPEIRLLTGKKRDIAIAELQQEAKELIFCLGPVDIYIPTNVASSKNSKQLFKTGKKNAQVTRDANGNTSTVIKETSFITDSQVSKAYRKQTEDSWKVNRMKFLSAVQGLKKPYRIELTFIRTTLGRMDFHNMAQLPFDLMVEHGWIADDESTDVVPVFNPVVYYSKYYAGLVIRVIR